MSAHVLRSPRPTAAAETGPGLPPRTPHGEAAIEPSLVNRLLGVAVGVFAVPVVLELRRLLAPAETGPTRLQEASLFAASAVLALGFALVLRRAPRLVQLRAGRLLCAALAFETAALGAAWLVRAAG